MGLEQGEQVVRQAAARILVLKTRSGFAPGWYPSVSRRQDLRHPRKPHPQGPRAGVGAASPFPGQRQVRRVGQQVGLPFLLLLVLLLAYGASPLAS
jgi:hypothetical protein